MSQLLGTKADFSQNDPRWRGKFLGFSTRETVGAYGCLITAMANVGQAMQRGIDPSEVNEQMKVNKLFSGAEKSNVSRADALSIICPGIKFIEVKEWGANTVAPLSYFDVRSTTKTEIIIKIDYHPERAGLQEHWVRVIGLNPAKTDIEILDSWDGRRKWLSSISSKGSKRPNQLIWKAWKFTR